MTEENKKGINLNLILPAGLLLLLVIVFVVLVVAGYQITQFLFYFFLLLGIFLVFQVAKQLITEWRVKQAIKKIDDADLLAESGQPMEAIKLWKNLLLSLPKDQYLEVLRKMEETYQDQNMTKAVEQVKAIFSESLTYFKMAKGADRGTPKDKQDWRTRAYELRNMIKALPEAPDQNLTDVFQ